ncbi:MAG: hemolysin family protein [Bryobacteraceae bacterium]|nr:hemolysin family protein [Bryobacteraceae bacterium]
MNDPLLGYRLLLLACIVAMNAFFASAEAALIAVRQSKLREMAERGQLGAQAALGLLANPARLLSTVQVGVTLAGLAAGWVGEDTVYRLLLALAPGAERGPVAWLLHGASFVCAFLILTFAMVVAGEVVPKNLAIQNSDRFAVLIAPPLLVFARLMQPFVSALERSAALLSRLLGLRGQSSVHSVEELKMITSSVREAGRISRIEEQAVLRLLELDRVAVREIMVPRRDMVALPADATLEQVLRTALRHPFSRFPVYDREPEQIIGILHYKDLMAALARQRLAGGPFSLRPLVRRPLVVPESKPLSQMIEEFRAARRHMALVVDEFGTIVGLATFEDVLEEVFGEIEDEHDVRQPPPALEAPVLELEGNVSIRDLATQYGIELPANAGFETLAGFLLHQLGYIPRGGESVAYEGRRYTILEMDRRRIARVRIEKASPGGAQQESSEERK